MQSITLKIQSCGGAKPRFRLGVSIKDSQLFKIRGIKVRIKISKFEFITKTTCGQWYDQEKKVFKKGFDLYSRELSQYIIKNELNYYPKRVPKTLSFSFALSDNCVSLINE